MSLLLLFAGSSGPSPTSTKGYATASDLAADGATASDARAKSSTASDAPNGTARSESA